MTRQVLLVDDDDELRLAVDRQLCALGCEVVVVSNGEDVMRVAAEQVRIDVLLTELRLPDIDGREQAITDAVEDALLEYIARPQRFDPARGVPLEMYLRFAAARNLRNGLRGEARRAARERRYAEETARRPRQPRLAPRKISAILAAVCDASERAAAEAWCAGERRAGELARLLGMAALADGERRREIKRFKDRSSNGSNASGNSGRRNTLTAEVELCVSAGNYR